MTTIAYARVIVPKSPRYETNRKVTAYEQKAQRFLHNALRFAQKALRYGKSVAGFARKPPRNFVPGPPERLSQAVGRPWNIMPIQKLRKLWKRAGAYNLFRPSALLAEVE